MLLLEVASLESKETALMVQENIGPLQDMKRSSTKCRWMQIYLIHPGFKVDVEGNLAGKLLQIVTHPIWCKTLARHLRFREPVEVLKHLQLRVGLLEASKLLLRRRDQQVGWVMFFQKPSQLVALLRPQKMLNHPGRLQ
jgi:hypothetical protein